MIKDVVSSLVDRVEKKAAHEAKFARAAYKLKMDGHRAAFKEAERREAKIEREELKRIERWRVSSIAALSGAPVPLQDIQSVKREVRDGSGGTKSVSVARLKCLETK